MCVERKSERSEQKHTILGSNPEEGVRYITQDSFDSCILLSGQISIKKGSF